MKRIASPDGLLALVFIVASIVVLIAWIPNDIETGLIEKMRRQVRIGDMMLPVVALGFVIVGSLMTLARPQMDTPRLSQANVIFLAKLIGAMAIGLLLMRWVGPIAVEIFTADGEYRVLRDERPWKYLGFVVGGTGLVMGLMALMEGRLSWRGVVVGLCAVVALIAIYDLPFDDLLLPPNGDV